MDLHPAALNAIRKEHDALVEKRRNMTREIDEEINALAKYLVPSWPTSDSLESTVTVEQAIAEDNPRAQNRMAVELCQVFLAGGQQIKSPDLYAMVEAAGVKLKAADPVHRLVQLLSERKEIFQSDRKNGWSLKGEAQTGGDPSATSSATQSVEDLT